MHEVACIALLTYDRAVDESPKESNCLNRIARIHETAEFFAVLSDAASKAESLPDEAAGFSSVTLKRGGKARRSGADHPTRGFLSETAQNLNQSRQKQSRIKNQARPSQAKEKEADAGYSRLYSAWESRAPGEPYLLLHQAPSICMDTFVRVYANPRDQHLCRSSFCQEGYTESCSLWGQCRTSTSAAFSIDLQWTGLTSHTAAAGLLPSCIVIVNSPWHLFLRLNTLNPNPPPSPHTFP